MQAVLIELARNGDEDALIKLYRQYQPVVQNLRKQYFLGGFDEQDWQQEGFIVFHKCIKIFDTI